MHLAVDDGDRREAAAAEAADGLDGEHAVVGGRVDADAELLLELLDEVVAAAQVAGGAEADLDDVLAGLLELEEVVEGDDAVDLRERDLQELARLDRDRARDVAVGLLHLVQHHDQVAGLVFPFFDERLQLRRHLDEVFAHFCVLLMRDDWEKYTLNHAS